MEEKLLTWPQRGRLWLRLGIRGALLAAGALLTVYVLVPLACLLMPFVLALLLAWLFDPIVRRLKERTTLSRGTLSLAVLLLALLTVGSLCWGLGKLLFAQLGELLENWDLLVDGTRSAAEGVEKAARQVGKALPAPVAAAGERLLDGAGRWLSSLDLSGAAASLAAGVTRFVAALPGFAAAAAVFLMAGYFLTSDYPRVRSRAAGLLSKGARRFLGQVKGVLQAAFGGYLKSQLLLTLGVFLLLAAGFTVIRQPYGLLLALALAILDFVPLIGAGTALVPWAVFELLTGRFRHGGELMAVWGVVVIFRRVAEPKILGDQTGLSPILSLLGIYVGMKAGGVLGMLLGPVALLAATELLRLGLFRSALDDLRLAAADISALLGGGRF